MPTLLDNKKVHFNYEILERFQAGLEIAGHEVKALREKMGGLDGAYVTIRGGEAYLINSFIPPYQPANTDEAYDPRRNRRLLLTKKEILHLSETEHHAGLTIVPISVYNKFVQDHCRSAKIPCLHAGLFADYGEVMWDERYKVPGDPGEGDVCDYPLARNIILLTVVVAQEEILDFFLNPKPRKKNWSITLKDLKIKEM